MNEVSTSLLVVGALAAAMLLGFAIAARSTKPCPAPTEQKIVLEVRRGAN